MTNEAQILEYCDNCYTIINTNYTICECCRQFCCTYCMNTLNSEYRYKVFYSENEYSYIRNPIFPRMSNINKARLLKKFI